MKCKLVKVGKGMKAAAAPKLKVGAGVGGFELHVGEDGSCTVLGSRDDGSQVDISDVATLTVSSGDTSVVTVSTPSGMTFVETAVALGHSDVAITATWNDGSIGPFSITDPVDVVQPPPGPVTGLVIVHQPPVVH